MDDPMKTCLPRNTARSKPRGAALVELTLVLAVLLTVVFGCIDLGRFATVDIALTNAAREAAAVGSARPYTSASYGRWVESVRQAAVDEMAGVPQFDAAELTMVNPVRTLGDGYEYVHVEITYPFSPLMPWPIVNRPLEITRSADLPVVR